MCVNEALDLILNIPLSYWCIYYTFKSASVPVVLCSFMWFLHTTRYGPISSEISPQTHFLVAAVRGRGGTGSRLLPTMAQISSASRASLIFLSLFTVARTPLIATISNSILIITSYASSTCSWVLMFFWCFFLQTSNSAI